MTQDVSGSVDLSFLVDSTPADASDVTIPFNDVVGVINNMLNGVQLFDRMKSIYSLANVISSPLVSSANGEFYDGSAVSASSGSGNYPSSFTEVDAPSSTSLTQKQGKWFLQSLAADVWKYRQQTAYDIEAMAGSTIALKVAGCVPQNVGSGTDDDWRFGWYANNAGSIDETKYARAHLQWDSAGSQFRVRGEASDGTSTWTGSWYNFPWLMYPFSVGIRIWKAVDQAYIYAMPFADESAAVLIAPLSYTSGKPTFGQAWMQYHLTKGGSSTANIFIDGHDFY